MNKKKYSTLAFLHFIFGVVAIFLYFPYTINAFNIKGFGWLDFASKILKDNYFDVLVYFGVFLLIWFIVLNITSVLDNANISKTLFKLSIVASSALPLLYVLAIKNDAVLNFWIDNVSQNVKMIACILLSLSAGMFVLALIFNFTKIRGADFYQVLQALVMVVLLALFVSVNGWIDLYILDINRLFGILMGLFAIYLPISSIILLFREKNR